MDGGAEGDSSDERLSEIHQAALNQDLFEDTETSNVIQDSVGSTVDTNNNEGTAQFNQAFAFLE